jgi:2,4-diaminopentanoate dehydrogenase
VPFENPRDLSAGVTKVRSFCIARVKACTQFSRREPRTPNPNANPNPAAGTRNRNDNLGMPIRVLVVGLGPIGASVAKQIVARKGFQLVGAVDIDPQKVGRDVAEVIGLERALRVKVTGDISKTIKSAKPHVAVLCTSSSLKSVVGQFEAVLRHRVAIVSTTEEAAYPSRANRRLAARLDAAARKAKVAVLGTGVNPGFTMDALPIALTAVCERVDSIEVLRVQDARIRRLPFQQKIGAGLMREQFDHRVAVGTVRHVGFTESIQMIADAVGWKLDRVTDEIEPKMAGADVASDLLSVRAGQVCGLIQRGTGYVAGEPRIRLRLEAYLGAPESYESVLIEGSPRIHSRIDGGVHGDIATASMAVNSIPAVLASQPGFRTMRDMRLPSFYGGT